MSAVLRVPKPEIRPMREADLSRVMAVEREAYAFPWSEQIFRDCLRVGYSCWVIERGGVLDAYGVMSVGAGESHILNLCVRPAVQRRGLGREVLAHLLQLARRHRAETVLLEVRPSNRAAFELYRNMGFNEVGIRRGYYPGHNGREDAVILARDLTELSDAGPGSG
jgi:ribosomal-protein-alanine N-acetyltransferase